MIIETEPSGLMMIRYKFYFNQQSPDPEDPWVQAYFQEHGLEPRRELHEEHEGSPYKRPLPSLTLPHGKNLLPPWQRACMPQPSSRRRKTEIYGW
jgi:hypothetical protein